MMRQESESRRLAGWFADPPRDAEVGVRCVEPERILDAVIGKAPRSEARELADHAATCAACALAWRLARDYAAESGMLRGRRNLFQGSTWAMVAVFALAAVCGVLWFGRDDWRPDPAPAYRSVPHEPIHSLVSDEPLPADAFVLRWDVDVEGARYDVRVTDRRLNPIAEGRSLTVPEYTVPPEALGRVGPGEILLWQVEIQLPDGRKLESQTFTARLE